MCLLFSGLELCFGQPVDSELLKLVNNEVAELRESIEVWKEDVQSDQVYSIHNYKTVGIKGLLGEGGTGGSF